jgi:hypothetical protein
MHLSAENPSRRLLRPSRSCCSTSTLAALRRRELLSSSDTAKSRPSETVCQIGKLTKGKSDDTTCASGPRATELRVIHNRAFRSGQSDCATCAPQDAISEYHNSHMSDQLRHTGNELPEFLPSDRCPNSGRSREYRRLQPQLLYSAACVQTAVLKRPLPLDRLAPVQRTRTRRR